MALNDFSTYNPILQDILILLTSLDRVGKSVVFCWIPSHMGIAGNERADEAAKRASLAECSRFLPLPARDSLALCSSYIRANWQIEWETARSSKLKVIKPRLAPWASSSRTHRKEEVQLCRLRIGHTLVTHRYLLCGGSKPRCSRCGDNLSVAHVLVSCRRLAAERLRYLGSTSLSLEELLGNESGHISQIFRFLSKINFPIIFTQT